MISLAIFLSGASFAGGAVLLTAVFGLWLRSRPLVVGSIGLVILSTPVFFLGLVSCIRYEPADEAERLVGFLAIGWVFGVILAGAAVFEFLLPSIASSREGSIAATNEPTQNEPVAKEFSACCLVPLVGLGMLLLSCCFPFSWFCYWPIDPSLEKQIKPGMTKDEVRAILGPPLERRPLDRGPFNFNGEDWLYYVTFTDDFHVYFDKGIVVEAFETRSR
jgi:hypothetical protein